MWDMCIITLNNRRKQLSSEYLNFLMCHRYPNTLTSPLCGTMGRSSPIQHFTHLNHHQKYHGALEDNCVPQLLHNVDRKIFKPKFALKLHKKCIKMLKS